MARGVCPKSVSRGNFRIEVGTLTLQFYSVSLHISSCITVNGVQQELKYQN